MKLDDISIFVEKIGDLSYRVKIINEIESLYQNDSEKCNQILAEEGCYDKIFEWLKSNPFEKIPLCWESRLYDYDHFEWFHLKEFVIIADILFAICSNCHFGPFHHGGYMSLEKIPTRVLFSALYLIKKRLAGYYDLVLPEYLLQNLEQSPIHYRIPYDVFQIRLLWDDIYAIVDFSAILLKDDGKLLDDDYFVFYNSKCRLSNGQLLRKTEMQNMWDTYPCDPEISIVGSCGSTDDLIDDCPDGYDSEWFGVNLPKIRNDVQEVVFVSSIYDSSCSYKIKGNMKIQFENEGNTFLELDISKRMKNQIALEILKLVRCEGNWIVEIIGQGHKNGLVGILDKYC